MNKIFALTFGAVLAFGATFAPSIASAQSWNVLCTNGVDTGGDHNGTWQKLNTAGAGAGQWNKVGKCIPPPPPPPPPVPPPATCTATSWWDYGSCPTGWAGSISTPWTTTCPSGPYGAPVTTTGAAVNTCTPPTGGGAPPGPPGLCANGATDYPTCSPACPAPAMWCNQIDESQQEHGNSNFEVTWQWGYTVWSGPQCYGEVNEVGRRTFRVSSEGSGGCPPEFDGSVIPVCDNGGSDYPVCTPPRCANGASDYPTCTPAVTCTATNWTEDLGCPVGWVGSHTVAHAQTCPRGSYGLPVISDNDSNTCAPPVGGGGIGQPSCPAETLEDSGMHWSGWDADYYCTYRRIWYTAVNGQCVKHVEESFYEDPTPRPPSYDCSLPPTGASPPPPPPPAPVTPSGCQSNSSDYLPIGSIEGACNIVGHQGRAHPRGQTFICAASGWRENYPGNGKYMEWCE
jgi:hypothetical protein